MKRLIIICEGETEQAFVRTVLQPHFFNLGIIVQAPLIKASRGGIVKWSKLKSQIETHLRSERDVFVTTLIDYYGLYDKYQFPNWDEAHRIVDRNARMDSLENSMFNDIHPDIRHRYKPYIQLHEFEGLLFNDLQIIIDNIPGDDLVGMEELNQVFNTYSNPELINNNRETAPSYRLMRIISGYNKIVYGDILAEAIGLIRIREKSPRFNNWIENLETL